MDDSTTLPDPPVGVPDDVGSTLRGLTVHELRLAIIYAQELLQARHRSTTQIEPGPGEEIVELVEEPGYLRVVKREPCGAGCDECPHGPFVYHVTRDRHPDGSERFHWTLIGRQSDSSSPHPAGDDPGPSTDRQDR